MATSRRAGRCTDRLSGRPAGSGSGLTGLVAIDDPPPGGKGCGAAIDDPRVPSADGWMFDGERTPGELGNPQERAHARRSPAASWPRLGAPGIPAHPDAKSAAPASIRPPPDPREPITAREDRLYGVLRPGPATSRPRPVNGAQNGSEEPPDDFPAPRAGETGRGRTTSSVPAGDSSQPRTSPASSAQRSASIRRDVGRSRPAVAPRRSCRRVVPHRQRRPPVPRRAVDRDRDQLLRLDIARADTRSNPSSVMSLSRSR